MSNSPQPEHTRGAGVGPDRATESTGGQSGRLEPVTGVERDCLRQAVHDLRGRLNTGSILIDLCTVLASKDPDRVPEKLAKVVQELRCVARMLDQLVGTSDSLAPELAPLDLGATIANVAKTCPAAARGVVIDYDALTRSPVSALACPTRLPRALFLIVEKGLAALPEGGSLRCEAEPTPDGVRLTIRITGPRVLPVQSGRMHLTDGAQPNDAWFPVLALVRGMRGRLDVAPCTDGLQVAIDLPRSSGSL